MSKKCVGIKQIRVPDDLYSEMETIKNTCAFKTSLPTLFEHAARVGIVTTRKLFAPTRKTKPTTKAE